MLDERPGGGAGRLAGPPGEGDAPAQPGPGERDGPHAAGVRPGDRRGQQGHAETPAGQLGDQLRIPDLEADAGRKPRRGRVIALIGVTTAAGIGIGYPLTGLLAQ